ncbi:hypothetical protein RJ641_028943 [Dillenia turbinata]|uniref:AP2/ERF domain-containing protein n=1 Tax=Dillenia turbinata TaxID=194707 RepID=A0AAN8W0V9_9MAGN
MEFGERKQQAKNPSSKASSRKGCMRGKGGPENASCSYKRSQAEDLGQVGRRNSQAKSRGSPPVEAFNTSHDAAIAYDTAACKLYRPESKLNLPELCPQTRLYRSLQAIIGTLCLQTKHNTSELFKLLQRAQLL